MKENMKYDTNYYQLREFIIDRMKVIMKNNQTSKPNGVVFFGDSITELCDLEKFYPELDNKYNSGIGGITSTMLLNFIDEGVNKFNPDKVVIMIGTNDLGKTVMRSPRDIAIDVKEMIEIIHYNLLDTKIYLVSPIPCLEDLHSYKATKEGIRSNDVLKMIYTEYKSIIPYDYVEFIDAYPALCNEFGEPIREYFTDGLHINDEGYKCYTECIKKSLLKK